MATLGFSESAMHRARPGNSERKVIDFENKTYTINADASDLLPWDATATTVINLTNALSTNGTSPLFLVLGIEFYQEVNGAEYPLKNGSFNALSIVKVSVA